jgi:hypothetical protein
MQVNRESMAIKSTNRAPAKAWHYFKGDGQPFSQATHAPRVEGPNRAIALNQDGDEVRQLVAGVAHVYNNLFTSMLCGTGLALDRIAADHPARPVLKIASGAME